MMTPTRRQRLEMIGAWAFGAAMLTGLIHVLIASVDRFVLDGFILVSREYAWMMPTGYAIIFASVALALGFLALVYPRAVGPRVTGFAFGSLGALSILLLYERLYPLASMIAALGVGVRIAAWAGGDARRRAAVIGRTGVALALAFTVSGAVLTVARRWSERAAIGSLRPASQESPNVLIIILDTVRAANVSLLGYQRETTPLLARRAMQGAIFDNAYSTAPWTLPSHAGMFTGFYPLNLAADWRVPLETNKRTVAEIFKANGYYTAGFTANHAFTGWETGLARGFIHYDDYMVTLGQILLSTSFFQTNVARVAMADPSPLELMRAVRHLRIRPIWRNDRSNAGFVTAQFLEWERTRSSRPFFAFVNLFDAHGPYDPPGQWSRRFAAGRRPADRYDGAIAYLDHEVSALLDSLEKRGILDNTVVVITSDHGEELGEHGLVSHGLSLYRMELHVPLVVRYPPRVPAGVRISEVVSLGDLAATVIDLAGANAAPPLPGVSLVRTWSDTSAAAGFAVSEVKVGIRAAPTAPVMRGPLRSLVDDELHYIRDAHGKEELYSWRDDPGETRDLAAVDTARLMRARNRLDSGATSANRQR